MAGKKYRILIVDDSEINRTILEEIFGTEYEVIEAGSVEAAVELLQKSINAEWFYCYGINDFSDGWGPFVR